MNSKELRIGNLVEYFDQVVTVRGVTEENPFVNTITPDYLEYDEITPIPLTEEWLLKFGFALNDSIEMRYWVKNSVMLSSETSDSILTHSLVDFVPQLNVLTVHQLQNLYFTLTNEELNHDEG